MARNDIHVTPAGRALYPKLTEPDTKFNKDGTYSVKLLLSAEDATPILNLCETLRQEAADGEFEKQREAKPKMKPEKIREGIKLADLPIKPYEDPETGEETGEYAVNFKMTASGVSAKTGREWTRRPALFDAQNNPIDLASIDIWSGSLLKVAFTANPFYTASLGAGATMRLEAVQVLELVSGGQRDASGYGFGAQQGGYTYTGGGSDEQEGDPCGTAFGGDGGDTSAEGDF